MKEQPILFCGEMVQAILDGRKTQTRRVMPQPFGIPDTSPLRLSADGFVEACVDGRWICLVGGTGRGKVQRCPYGVPGDHLWVKESFAKDTSNCPSNCTNPEHVFYRASYGYEDDDVIKWRPSIFMPRWVSRITLEVVSVRVQRVQEISEWDARAEGLTVRHDGPNIVAAYRLLWNAINAKRGYSWDANPWVWAVEFRRCD